MLEGELSVLRQRLAALGVTQDSSVGMISSHNPTGFASSASSSTWVIESGATDNVTTIHLNFLSYNANAPGRVRTDCLYAPIAGKGTEQISSDLFFYHLSSMLLVSDLILCLLVL